MSGARARPWLLIIYNFLALATLFQQTDGQTRTQRRFFASRLHTVTPTNRSQRKKFSGASSRIQQVPDTAAAASPSRLSIT